MKTTTNANANEKKLSIVNFDKFSKKTYNVSEKVSGQRSTLYNYPENFSALQINGIEGKNFRSKLRNNLTALCNRLYLSKKAKDGEKFVNAAKDFLKFYKENFKLNDFSINSITNTKNEKQAFILDCLNDVKEYVAQTSSEKKTKKATPKKSAKKEEETSATTEEQK